MMKINEENHMMVVCLYVAGILHRLHQMGYISEPPYKLTGKGVGSWDQVHAMAQNGELYVSDVEVTMALMSMSEVPPEDQNTDTISAIVKLCRMAMSGKIEMV